METRANYVLIGLFTVLGVLGALLFFVWLARFQVERQYNRFDVLFNSVSGLSRAAEVRYNGLPVGQVLSLGLYSDDDSKVRARIEVDADVPVNEGTTAQLEVQGVTGVSFVALSSGRPDAPPLAPPEGERVPVIVARPSIFEQLTQDAPDLLSQATRLMANAQTLLSSENVTRVGTILSNLEQVSAQLETTLSDVSSISGTAAQAADSFGAFTAKLDPVTKALEGTLKSAEQTLDAARTTFQNADTTLASATSTLDGAQPAVEAAEGLMRDDLPALVAELREAVSSLQGTIDAVGAEAGETISRFGTTADLANERLTELQSTLTAVDKTLTEAGSSLQAIESASTSFETLIDGEGTQLLSGARGAMASAETAIAAINTAATDDLPAIMADIRGAVSEANRTIETVGADITRFTDGLAPLTNTAQETLSEATVTLRDARGTMAALDTALGTADRTLTAAETTFVGANRIIDEEVAPTAADIRAASADFSRALEQVSQDLPAVTGDLRTAIARATDVIDRLDGVVAQTTPPVQEFATVGLPQFTRFAQEARALVLQLERITARLEQDPARFLLGRGAPDYRR